MGLHSGKMVCSLPRRITVLETCHNRVPIHRSPRLILLAAPVCRQRQTLMAGRWLVHRTASPPVVELQARRTVMPVTLVVIWMVALPKIPTKKAQKWCPFFPSKAKKSKLDCISMDMTKSSRLYALK